MKTINPVVNYIIQSNSSLIEQYFYDDLRRRKVNTIKVAAKLREVYGRHYTPTQFLEFGEKYLNEYLIEKHQISFIELLEKAFEPIVHRFRHLA